MASRQRQSAAGPSAPRPSQTAADHLNHEAPRGPLNQQSLRELNQVGSQSSLRSLQSHLKQANELIAQMAGEVNERLCEREDEVRRAQARREQKGRDITEEEERDEANVGEMRERVETMTRKMEEWTRKVIDGQQSLTNMCVALQASKEAALNATSRAETEDEPSTQQASEIPSVLDTFQGRLQFKEEQYQTFPFLTRYAKDNAYIGFRRNVHDAQHRDDGVPLPNPNTWFTESGEPAPGLISREAVEDDDEDIAIARERISTKCPLTLKEIREPLKSLRCPHVFEKSAILEMISLARNNRGVQCPVPGCSNILAKNGVQEDPILAKKIKRIQQAKETQQDSESEEEESTNMVEDDAHGHSRSGTVQPKAEPDTHPKRAVGVVDLGSEDSSDEDED